MYAQACVPVDERSAQQEQPEPWIPAHVKIVAGQQEQRPPPPVRHHPVEREHYREKKDEVKGVKKHTVFLPQRPRRRTEIAEYGPVVLCAGSVPSVVIKIKSFARHVQNKASN